MKFCKYILKIYFTFHDTPPVFLLLTTPLLVTETHFFVRNLLVLTETQYSVAEFHLPVTETHLSVTENNVKCVSVRDK